MARKKYLNVHYKNSEQWQGPLLCPLESAGFGFDKKLVASLESFVHALKVRPSERALRGMMLMEPGIKAHKRFSQLRQPVVVQWEGDAMEYGDEDYNRLLVRIIRARMRQDHRAQVALVASCGFELVHERIKHDHILSSISSELYCGTLMTIRDEIMATGKVRMTS
jgi:hypothetical protein